ncbi:MAG: FKBP-type peptidyl-prolyl cis-trans isomerase [Verrucomicrobia bacterium]|nr:FKBP-type peptidyl-prolyl cis-trans isomerase [Verrucomicrobiota bacterium]MDA1068688.1 FKBP-type peptidyl-prolyl cis-trans isomerase [Verrucomicrobiota bacterium]
MITNAFYKILFSTALSFLSLWLVGCGKQPNAETVEAKDPVQSEPIMTEEITEKQKIFRTLGFSIGTDLMLNSYSEDEVAQIIEGFRLASKGEKPEYVDGLQEEAFQIFNDKRSSAAQKQEQSAVADNKAAGEAYFAQLDGKEGITTTGSGLRYEILNKGSETYATASDSVNVHYHGTLIDGTVFDSSVDRGEPVTFPLSGVIKGFSEGLTLVGEGGKIRLYMPSDIAYGDRGAGGAIGPGASLIFEVEILKINP